MFGSKSKVFDKVRRLRKEDVILLKEMTQQWKSFRQKRAAFAQYHCVVKQRHQQGWFGVS